MIWDKSLVPTDLLDALSTRSSFHKFDYLGSYFVRFNTAKNRSMILACTRRWRCNRPTRIVEKYTKGGERPASALCPTKHR